MAPNPDQHHYVRKVVLPSGKTIEVVYFEDQVVRSDAVAPSPGPAETRTPLHLCGSCDSNLVYPTEWSEAGPRHWEVTLRCPNCEWHGTGVFEQELVEEFDDELDRGTETLVSDLRRILHANMEDEIDRFVRALDAGHIQPEDF
ncbi:hypothetical protein [Paraconexibacter sp.]|uniref:hypothetical protein n=1 Tax=Paraconexibacter sp. TaxID=2949640 RepID=UPI0035661BF1